MSVDRVDKPWGYELHWAKTARYVGKLIHVNKGHALSLQYHNVKDETIFLWAGKLLFEIEIEGALTSRETLPGESVRVSNGNIYVNDRRLPEPYLEHGTMTSAPRWAEQTIHLGGDEYLVLGDNRAESEDSRFYGPVARGQIVGTLIK